MDVEQILLIAGAKGLRDLATKELSTVETPVAPAPNSTPETERF